MILITAIFRLCYLVFLLYKVIVYMLKWAKTLKSLDWGVRPSYKLIFKISIWNIFKSIRIRFLIIPTIIYWTRPRKQSISINFKSKGFRLMSQSLSWMYLGLANMYKQLSKTGRIIELIIFYGMMKWIVWNCMLNRIELILTAASTWCKPCSATRTTSANAEGIFQASRKLCRCLLKRIGDFLIMYSNFMHTLLTKGCSWRPQSLPELVRPSNN